MPFVMLLTSDHISLFSFPLCRSYLNIFCDVLDLSEEQLKFFQQFKEEEVSDSELIESSCDEENEDQTWHPSESDVEEWMQGKEKKTEYKESLKQGHYLLQIVNLCFG